MCIAVIKQNGVAMPSRDVLEICFKNNSDGAGFAVREGDGVIKIRKGLMTFQSFWDSLSHEGDLFGKDVFMHFRIKTHGKKNEGQTHPFPITDSYDTMLLTKHLWAGDVMMHNGIINIKADDKYSDSMHFVKTIYGMDYWHNKEVQNLIALASASSRVAIMSPYGGIIHFGSWEMQDGVLYSNSGYKPRPVYGYGYGNYWDEGDFPKTDRIDPKKPYKDIVPKNARGKYKDADQYLDSFEEFNHFFKGCGWKMTEAEDYVGKLYHEWNDDDFTLFEDAIDEYGPLDRGEDVIPDDGDDDSYLDDDDAIEFDKTAMLAVAEKKGEKPVNCEECKWHRTCNVSGQVFTCLHFAKIK